MEKMYYIAIIQQNLFAVKERARPQKTGAPLDVRRGAWWLPEAARSDQVA